MKLSKFPTVSIGSFPYSGFYSETNPPTYSLNTFPSITVVSIPSLLGSQPSYKIPASLAIAIAVFLLSPVTILTLTPAS